MAAARPRAGKAEQMYKIAIYGKGGIGKSTTASNLSAALARKGLKVMQVGCDPKADSTQNLTGGVAVRTVLDAMRDGGRQVSLSDIVVSGYRGVLCVEAGGPTPGVGCAGRGIITAFDKLSELNAFEVYQPDVVIYDVLGDVVCGGFAMPIRGGYARHVFVVTSGEKMALYAAGNIALAIDSFKSRGYARYSGIILNARNVEGEREKVEEFAERTDGRVISVLSRSPLVQQAESRGQTVVEAFPDSGMAQEYAQLAQQVLQVCEEEERDA